MSNVRQLPIRQPADDTEATVANLTAAMEQLDSGMKMALDLLVQYDKRLRALEIARRKAERKNAVLVNSMGDPVN